MKKLVIVMMIAAGVISGCKGRKTPALDPSNLDKSVAPSADFYEYATGGWQKNHPMGAEYSRYGSFDMLRESALEQLKTIVEQLVKQHNEENTNADKIAKMYVLGMDMISRNNEGFSPVLKQWEDIYAIGNRSDFTAMIATLHHQGIHPYFGFYVAADEKSSNVNLAQLSQPRLGMGDRDYYLETNEQITNIRNAYKKYMETLFTLAGFDQARSESAANNVLAIETALAKIQYSRVQLRDSYLNYNKMPLSKLFKMSTFIDWTAYFDALGVGGKFNEINVAQKDYYTELDKVMADFSLNEAKDYLAFSLLNSASNYLSNEFVKANFEFYGRALSGREEMRPLWKRTLSTVDGALSEALGELYVEQYFPETSKAKMLLLVENLRTALGERINSLVWMGDATKAKAQEKLAAFTVKIGYPDTWRDYSGLEIVDDSYWANVVRSNIFDMDYNFADLGKPVDKARWLMSPQTVNAYYNPTTNEICFPAAILQPPFFNPDADDAVNYGGIGVVIGHEMGHGFDDQGRNYDAFGNMTDWWTATDAEKFKALADVLVKQYDAIVIAEGVNANGSLTLGENIGDHGGLLISYQAFHNSLSDIEPQPIDGFTADQRFFLSYATIWAQNVRPEEELRLTKMDVHSLGKWRVNAAIRNIDAFYKAFDIKEGDPMWLAPEERVVIW